MYYFTIGAVFKNEAHILKEWIEHYLYHSVDHIYMINDNSNDNFLEILQPFIDKNLVPLYNAPIHDYRGGEWPQTEYYNMYFLKHLNETKWFGIFDLDEFLYSPNNLDLKNPLKLLEDKQQLQINWVHFGSSGFKEQPKNVVENFLYRGEYNSIKNGPNGKYNSYKSIINCNYNNESIQLGIHRHIKHNIMDTNISFDLNEPIMLVNHYAIQSVEAWNKRSKTSAIGNHYPGFIRDIHLFNQLDVNDVNDTRLKLQNSKIGDAHIQIVTDI